MLIVERTLNNYCFRFILSELECLCNGYGDPAVISYDGRAKMIPKTLLSRWNADLCDVCKFQVRVVTKDDIGGSASDLHCDWIGFAIGVHSVNSDKFEKNFVFANDLDGKGVVAIRGHGYPVGNCNINYFLADHLKIMPSFSHH